MEAHALSCKNENNEIRQAAEKILPFEITAGAGGTVFSIENNSVWVGSLQWAVLDQALDLKLSRITIIA